MSIRTVVINGESFNPLASLYLNSMCHILYLFKNHGGMYTDDFYSKGQERILPLLAPAFMNGFGILICLCVLKFLPDGLRLRSLAQ